MSAAPTITTQVEAVARELRTLIELLADCGPAPVADVIAAVESAGRMMDCARVRALAPLVNNVVLAERLGHTSPTSAVASIARISERSARGRLAVAAAVCPNLAITGAPIPARRPLVSDALDSGDVGLDAATLVATELDSIAGRASTEVLAVTESVMVGLATGVDAFGKPMAAAVSVDHLARELRQVTATADPDGARPREERARRRRDFRLGTPDDDGLVPASGRLVPEIGVLLAGLLESHRRSPRFVDSEASQLTEDDIPVELDPRTPGQRRHDAFAEVVVAAAGSQGAPRLDGQEVTTLVIVNASDLTNPDGRDSDPIGTMVGSPFPVSRSSVERFMDAGGFRVATARDDGVVTSIGSRQRCFTASQRLAIIARDGPGCSTPGCTSPHFALQAHHVIPHRHGGPTSVHNGILLCFWHHLMVDTGPWEYRMVDGMPQVRGPGVPEWVSSRRVTARAA
jgi:hypothetical protein